MPFTARIGEALLSLHTFPRETLDVEASISGPHGLYDFCDTVILIYKGATLV